MAYKRFISNWILDLSLKSFMILGPEVPCLNYRRDGYRCTPTYCDVIDNVQKY